MDKKLIGTINEDNSIDWPKTDVLGGAISLPATRHALTAKTFVVLPTGFNQWNLLQEMKGDSKSTTTQWADGEVSNSVITGLEAPEPESWQDTTFTGDETGKKGKK